MLLRRLTDFLLQSRLQAIGAAFVLTLVPFGGTVSILIAGLVTLCRGAFEGTLVLLAATLPYLVYVLHPSQDQPQLVTGVVAIMILGNVLTWAFAVLLRRFNNWDFILELAALLGILVIGGIHLFLPDVANWWGTQLMNYFSKTMPTVEMISPSVIPPEAQAQLVDMAKTYGTGFVTVGVLSNVLLQLLISRWWQAALFNPGGLRRELYRIRLGYTAGAVFTVGLILSYFGNPIVLDMMPTVYLAFCAAGLSLLHCLISQTSKAWVWLALVYTVLIWVFPYSVALIAVVALVDTWVDFRKRFA